MPQHPSRAGERTWEGRSESAPGKKEYWGTDVSLGFFVVLSFALYKQAICRQQIAHHFAWARIILYELHMDILFVCQIVRHLQRFVVSL